MNKLQHEIKVYPAWDRFSPDPSENYGQSDATLFFFVKDEHNSVLAFEISTGWYLDSTREAYPLKIILHSPVPMEPEQHLSEPQCDFTQGPCYVQHLCVDVESLFCLLVKEGSSGLFNKLDELFIKAFEFKDQGVNI